MKVCKSIYWLLWAGILLMSSCTKDSTWKKTADGEDGQGQSKTVIFTLQMPAITRAVQVPGTDQENDISDISVLVFKVDKTDPANPKEYFIYRTQGTAIEDLVSSNYKQFNAVVQKRPYEQRFVMIANAYNAVRDLPDADSTQLKEDILALLHYENNDAWHAAESGFKTLPMWGESEPEIVDDNKPDIDRVKMLRMVARVEVALSTTEVQENFEITRLYVYNHYTKGRVVPDTDVWDAANHVVTGLTMPETGAVKLRGPLEVEAVSIASEKTLPSTYLFESPAVELNQSSQATCLVIGGYYGEDGKESFYRVDFFEKTQAGAVTAYKDITRNHYYLVNINSVDGSGYPTPDEAFESIPMNMEIQILDWNEGDIADVTFDGQYYLGVSQGEFYLPRRAADDNLLLVITDYPGGWEVRFDTETYDWLDYEAGQYTTPETKEALYFRVTENDTGLERTGYFTITAGRLNYTVKVVQAITDGLTLTITNTAGEPITELFFRSHLGRSLVEAQQFQVTWTPDDADCMISEVVPDGVGFDPGTGHNPAAETSIQSGNRLYTIQPVPFAVSEIDESAGANPFLEKKSVINYFVGSGTEMVAKSIVLRQIHYDVLTDEEASYVMDGSTYSFTVRSNASWAAVVQNDPHHILSQLSPLTGGNNTTGQTMSFTMIDATDETYSTATAEIKFTYTGDDGLSEEKIVVINGTSPVQVVPVGEANSYMLVPDGEGVSIPVSQANADNTIRIANGVTVVPELLWTDSPNGMGANAPVKSFAISGTGSTARLNVVPGSQAGNAVIGVRVDGTIRWSWHIWVSEYTGDETYPMGSLTWMDRNLGATSNQPNSNGRFGLLYQWGRKDPFPGLASVSVAAPFTIYKAKDELTEINFENIPSENNLEMAIRYPMSFYRNSSVNSNDWMVSTNSTRNDNLWSSTENKKTPYDPCPEGWRTPWSSSLWTSPWADVPYNSTWDGTNRVRYWSSFGYWPMAGHINASSGAYENNEGRYWTGIGLPQIDTRSLIITTSGHDASGTNQRAMGLSVRCVKD